MAGTTKFASAKAPVEVTGDHPGMLLKLESSRVLEMAHSIISRYTQLDTDVRRHRLQRIQVSDRAASGGRKAFAD